MALTSFSTITLLSFAQWTDNWIGNRGQAYFNTSSRLYWQNDPQLSNGQVAYASPFRSWVWDSGVAGAIVADQISGSLGIGGTGQLFRGTSGMVIDYNNGRVIFPSTVGKNAIISGSYAVKEMNVYFANQSAEQIVFENKYYLNSRFNRIITAIPPPYEMVTPAVFIANNQSEDKNWSFGGLYSTEHNLTVYILAETPAQLEGVLSVLTDAQDAYFPQLDLSTFPLGPSGDFKGGTGYNYNTLVTQNGSLGNLFTITDVNGTKFGDGTKINDSIFIGACDFTVNRIRTIH